MSHPAAKTAFFFLPLVAAVTIDLAPPVHAEPLQRQGSRVTQTSGSRSTQSRPATPTRSSASQSRGSSGSRSSGSSLGSSRSSSGFGTGSRPSSSGTSRSSSRPASTPSIGVRPTTPTVTNSSNNRYIAPVPTRTPDRTNTAPTTNNNARTSAGTSNSGATSVGTGYVPRTSFPSPGTSGQTTYARRFNGGLELNKPATSERGGTLGPQGMGSVTSALEALRREDAANRTLRAPDSPGARFRAGDRATKLGLTPSRRTAAERMETARLQNAREAADDLNDRDLSQDRITTHRKQTARKQNARFDLAEETSSLLNRRVYNAEQAKAIDDGARSLGYATGAAISAATRGTLGTAGSRLAGTAFGGYDASNGSAFGGYGGGYVPPNNGYGYYGYWDAAGCYYSPYSSWWNFGFGYSSGWSWYVGYNACSPYWKSYWYSPWWYCSPAYYYPTYISHYYDKWDDDNDVTVHIYADGAVGESTTYGTANDVYVDAGAIYDAGYQDGVTSGVDGAFVNAVGGQPAAAQPAAPQPAPQQGLNSAALRYLELGDVAFTGGRYTDAVHFYTRAIEFQGDQGMLHLVLGDALFATGDYHAAAGSIRRALALDPMLVQAPIDKHHFYTTPTDFDVQLAKLELYYKEHPSDADARLVLALNYLFGGRPLAAMELLEKAPSTVYGEADMASALILDSARLNRWGANPPAEAEWK